MQNRNWKDAIIGFVQNEVNKRAHKNSFVEGVGCFRDLQGRKDISGFAIVRPWKSWQSPILLLFAFAWNYFIFPFAVALLGAKDVMQLVSNPSSYFLIIFPLTGAFLIYFSFAAIVNKTTYQITGSELAINHGPLPFGKNRKILRTDFAKIYVKKNSSTVTDNNGRTTKSQIFEVMARLKDSSLCRIGKSFDNYNDARILEQWLEHRLGLSNLDPSVSDLKFRNG